MDYNNIQIYNSNKELVTVMNKYLKKENYEK